MIGTHDSLYIAAVFQQSMSAVPADIKKAPQVTIISPHDDKMFIADSESQIITWRSKLADVTGIMPVTV
jgi:hypothetical protein